MSRRDKVRAGGIIPAAALNAPAGDLDHRDKFRAGPGLGIAMTPGGDLIGSDPPEGLYITLSGTTSPYDGVQALPLPDGTWRAGFRTFLGNVHEIGGLAGLAGQTIWAEVDGTGNARGRHLRRGLPGPCSKICGTHVDACTLLPIVGGTNSLVQGMTTTGPCTTDSHARCCLAGTSGAFALTGAATGYISRTIAGSAVCPPPPLPVTYGARYPTSGTTVTDDATLGTGVWANPGNAAVLDGVYSTAPSSANIPTHLLNFQGFDFTSLSPDTTDAIYQVKFEFGIKASALGATDDTVYAIKGGTLQTATNLATGTKPVPTGSIGSMAYTSPGSAWTWADILSSTFGFAGSFKASAAGGGMGTLVQAPAGSGTLGGTASNSFATATTAGNFLVAIVACSAGTITTPSGWTAGPTKTAGGSGDTVAIFYRANAPSATTISASLSVSARWTMEIAEYSGMPATATLDGTNTGTTDSGAITTTGAALVIAGIGGTSGALSGPSTGFTLQTSGAISGIASAFLWRSAGSAGTFTASCSGGSPNAGVIAAFSAGGTPTTLSCDFGRITVLATRATYEVVIPLWAATIPYKFTVTACAATHNCPIAGATVTVTSVGGGTTTGTTDALGVATLNIPNPHPSNPAGFNTFLAVSIAAAGFTTYTSATLSVPNCPAAGTSVWQTAVVLAVPAGHFCSPADTSAVPATLNVLIPSDVPGHLSYFYAAGGTTVACPITTTLVVGSNRANYSGSGPISGGGLPAGATITITLSDLPISLAASGGIATCTISPGGGLHWQVTWPGGGGYGGDSSGAPSGTADSPVALVYHWGDGFGSTGDFTVSE